MSIHAGLIRAVFLFDVAEAADLSRLTAFAGPSTDARLSFKQVTPRYVQYQQPPLTIDGEALGMAEVEGLRLRVRIYDFAVVSLALTRTFAGSWAELVETGRALMESTTLGPAAEAACRRIVERLHAAFDEPRRQFLSEDYYVFGVSALDEAMNAETLLDRHGGDIATLLRGERSTLARQERDEVLRNRLSYFDDDLVVPTWASAFIYDRPAGIDGALDIFELANSQLLTFRYYDDLLDRELGGIYAELKRPGHARFLKTRRSLRSADRIHALFVEVNELTDKSENALKLVGDVYAARLYALTAARLGLDRWKANVEEKLATLDAIYRFAVDQTQMSRGHLLELTIVAILVLELVLVFLGIMK